jgi:hypothetical protein
MKYKVGDKIKIIKGTIGCFGAEGEIGIVTNKERSNGLNELKKGFNVECDDGKIWRIGFDSVCELLDELTAEEAIRLQAEMCAKKNCSDCKLGSANNGMGIKCNELGKKYPERFVEILKQYKKDSEKKPIETEFIWYVQIVEADTHILKHEEPLKGVPEDRRIAEVLKKWCSEHEGKYYAISERRCVVKE